MTPIHLIDYGPELSEKERQELFYSFQNSGILNAVLQQMRDEAYASLAESRDQKLSGNTAQSDMAFGGWDLMSMVLVKIKAVSETAPEAEQ